MNTSHLYSASLLLIITAASCNSTGTTTTGTATTTTTPGDSTVTTTTTSTTYHHKYSGSFMPKTTTKYIDLKTNKEITVRIDTVRGSLVNDATNEPVDLFVEPMTHDTIYGQTGSVVNNYVIHDPSGDVRVDTLRINDAPSPAATATADADGGTGKVKFKENARGTKSKYKDDDEKIKEKNGKEKIKER